MVQYLYEAYSVLTNVVVNPAGAANPIVSDDWYSTIRDIARQEMGHLITVRNLALSLNAPPHLDRENFPIESDLYPVPFQLPALGNDTLAKAVAAEGPRVIRPDHQAASAAAKIAVGGAVSRVVQMYERLYEWVNKGIIDVEGCFARLAFHEARSVVAQPETAPTSGSPSSCLR